MTKDQMYFHTSDLDRNFKFTPILDKEPQKIGRVQYSADCLSYVQLFYYLTILLAHTGVL